MKELLSAAQMKCCDENTINKHGLPSLVLMERAALAVVKEITKRFDSSSNVLVVCGTGNNGGDGLAVARLLFLAGFDVTCLLLGDSTKRTDSFNSELSTCQSYDVPFILSLDETDHYDLIVDSIFGIGLGRDIKGDFAKAIDFINNSDSYVLAVDIPSGFSADSGKMLACGVIADLTVTFAYAKKGLFLADLALNCGEIIVADVGIYLDEAPVGTRAYALENKDLILVPERPDDANKGTCGKVLIIAGSQEIYGACYLSAFAALTTGSGLVKIYTHKNNIAAIQTSLPEAMYAPYEDYDEDTLSKLLEWADAIIIGPGLSTSPLSEQILKYVLEKATVPTLVDADGLNLLAKDLTLLDKTKAPVVLTPHLKEMERLCGQKVSYIKLNMEEVACNFVAKHPCTLVLKNFVTLIATSPDEIYINTSGSSALATAGSGDVLSGIIGSLLGQGLSCQLAAALGAYIHGLAGVYASEEKNGGNILAHEIVNAITAVN